VEISLRLFNIHTYFEYTVRRPGDEQQYQQQQQVDDEIKGIEYFFVFVFFWGIKKLNLIIAFLYKLERENKV